MMQKVILLAAIVAFASGASATQWKQCAPLTTKINRVKVQGCDPDHSSPDRCALSIYRLHIIEVDYIQPKPFKMPRVETMYVNDTGSSATTGCHEGGFVCPGEAGQVQHFKYAVGIDVPMKGSHMPTMRLTVREDGASTVDHFCIDISLLLIPPTPEAVARSESNSLAWRRFKRQHGKVYASREEEARRFAIFMDNKQLVERHNANTSASFKMALNHLADLNFQKHNKHSKGVNLPASPLNVISDEELDQILGSTRDGPLPEHFDWRQHDGRVSQVKNQGLNCLASWPFAATGLLEGQELVQNMSSFEILSEQILIDCSGSNRGCDGGWVALAFNDLAEGLSALESQLDYPYKGAQQSCQMDYSKILPMNKVKGFKLLPAKDEQTLKRTLVNYGPVSVLIQATDYFSYYKNGIFEDDTCTYDMPNHDVLVVGYGKDEAKGDYWIVKNSWGTNWGESGYIRIRAGKNMCGIADLPTIATF